MIDDPIVIDPPGFDVKAAWNGCKEYVAKCGGMTHDDGEPNWRAAAGADPGCCSCPRCHESYWAWGLRQKCGKCGAEYETDWWAMLSWGVQHARIMLNESHPMHKIHSEKLYQQRYARSAVYRWAAQHPDCSLHHKIVFEGTDWIAVWAGESDYVKEGEMVGGKVAGLARKPDGEVLLNVEDDHCGKGPTDRCAVRCLDPQDLVRVGDSVWWQAGKVYWTPSKDRRDYPRRGERPRDVPLVKVGYSH